MGERGGRSKVAIVTGGSRGIGLAIGKALAARRCRRCVGGALARGRPRKPLRPFGREDLARLGSPQNVTDQRAGHFDRRGDGPAVGTSLTCSSTMQGARKRSRPHLGGGSRHMVARCYDEPTRHVPMRSRRPAGNARPRRRRQNPERGEYFRGIHTSPQSTPSPTRQRPQQQQAAVIVFTENLACHGAGPWCPGLWAPTGIRTVRRCSKRARSPGQGDSGCQRFKRYWIRTVSVPPEHTQPDGLYS